MKKYKLILWRQVAGKRQFFWHIKASNGKIVAGSAEGYNRKRDMVTVLKKMFPLVLTGASAYVVLQDNVAPHHAK